MSDAMKPKDTASEAWAKKLADSLSGINDVSEPDRNETEARAAKLMERLKSVFNKVQDFETNGPSGRVRRCNERLDKLSSDCDSMQTIQFRNERIEIANYISEIRVMVIEVSGLIQAIEIVILMTLTSMLEALQGIPDVPAKPRKSLGAARDALNVIFNIVHPPGYAIVTAINGVLKLFESYFSSLNAANAKVARKSVVTAEWYFDLAEATVVHGYDSSQKVIAKSLAMIEELLERAERLLELSQP